MRKLSVLVAFLVLFSSYAMSQQVPRGMKYQAVARDKVGEVMANKKLFLRIALFSGAKPSNVYYSEVHELITNQLGLFDLVIGEGKIEKGDFSTVPWSHEDIWMQVSMRDLQNNSFLTISSSKLLAVPYAFHAATASELVSRNHLNATDITQNGTAPTLSLTTTSGTNASSGNSWNTGGNLGTTPPSQFLGTADNVYFVIKTNSIERMRIEADGNIGIKRTLSVGANLNVDSSANLNRIAGSTINYGPFTVGGTYPAGGTLRRSPSFLYGTLTVDANQATKLGGTLDVDLATTLRSSLAVFGPTDLNSRLSVNNVSPTLLSGTLQVNRYATFKQHVQLDTTEQSTSTTTGALVVNGGLGLGRNLNVGGDANFGGHTTFGGAVAITDQTQSDDTATGALKVTGGVAIGKNLNVGGATRLDSTLTVTDGTTLNSTLNVAGLTTISNATQSVSNSSGALVVAGGAGFAKNVYAGGTLNVTGAATLNSTLAANGQVVINANVSGGHTYVGGGYPLKVEGSDNGIAVKVNGSRTGGNHFISFFDDNGLQGRIEGQTESELENSTDYRFEKRQFEADIAFGAIDLVLAGFDAYFTLSNTVAAATSATACLGLGACVTSPIPSLIASSTAESIVAVAEVVATAAALTFTSINLGEYVAKKKEELGVTYESGAGDYAEYLMKENNAEKFMPGDIVGIKGGKISKNTSGAEKMMVISQKPIVLGNMPPASDVNAYEKVAFLGQVPVKVFGTVNPGDYIVANGGNNGVGVAVAANKLDSKNVKNIVGIAWSSASNPIQISTINVAVGLNVNDNQKLVESLEKQVSDLKGEISQISTQLEKLVPGFKGSSSGLVAAATTNAASQTTATPPNEFTVTPDETSTHYYQLTREDILKGVELAQKNMKDNGADVVNHPFWKKYYNDPSFKEQTIAKVLSRFNEQVAQMKQVNKKGGK